MILYPNDRKLLRFLRDKQSNERSFFFISNDYTFCIPIDKPKDSTLSQEAINELRPEKVVHTAKRKDGPP